MMNCGKKLDVRVIDGRTLISVTDMMNIHGDYGGSGALRKSWSQLKGNVIEVSHLGPNFVAQQSL